MCQVKKVKTFLLSDIVDQGLAFDARRVGVGEQMIHSHHKRDTGEDYMIMEVRV